MKNCPNCSGKLENGDRFCCWCGYVLPAAPEAEPAPAPIVQPAPAPAPVVQPVVQPAPAPAPAPVVQPVVQPAPAPAPAPVVQPAPIVQPVPAAAPAQSGSVMVQKSQTEHEKAASQKKLSLACIIGFSIAGLMALLDICLGIWSSASENIMVSAIWGIAFVISIVVFLASLIISIVGLVSAKKKKRKLWGLGLAGIIVSAVGEAITLVLTIILAAVVGLAALIGGAIAEETDAYLGKEDLHGDFLVKLKSYEESNKGSAITWYWDGDPDNNHIDVNSVDGIKLMHVGEQTKTFTIKLSDDLDNYFDTREFQNSEASDGYYIQETPSYFGIDSGTEVTFEEIEFTIHLSKNVDQVVITPEGAERYMAIVNEDGSITIYKYYVYFEVDARNEKFITDDGILALSDTGYSRRFFSGLDVDSTLYKVNDTNTTPVPTPDMTYTVPTDPLVPDDDNTFIITYGSGQERINLWTYSSDVPMLVGEYMRLHPEFGERYTVYCKITETDYGAYQAELDQALVAGGDDAPDIYVVDEDFAYKYTQGDLSRFAAAYKDLGLDVDNKVKEAEIAPYILDIGTRDGEIVGLSYESCSGAMIYRASIAREVFGTDDPAEIEKIIGAGSGSWDKFMEAAAKLGDAGYPIVSTNDDLWNVIQDTTSEPWVRDGELVISPERDEYLDLSKELRDNYWDKDGYTWSKEWYGDMNGTTTRNAFCFFGPSWFINYMLRNNCGGSYDSNSGTFGDWRVCRPPAGFNWGGTWILANKDTVYASAVAEFLDWVTLDCSETGCQYLYANGLIMYNEGCAVASNTVMRTSVWRSALCGGQDLAPVFADCNAYTSAQYVTEYDSRIVNYWDEVVDLYARGELDRDGVYDSFRVNVMDDIAF
ncbi:MAG: extracellular solute-binding protein [Clostridiales bacterium]|nr:extracellular solute-binding protein [Clostridiales bacterium]